MLEIMKKQKVSAKKEEKRYKEEPSEDFRSQKYNNKQKNGMDLISRIERTEELEDRMVEVTNLSHRENID